MCDQWYAPAIGILIFAAGTAFGMPMGFFKWSVKSGFNHREDKCGHND